MNKSMASAHIPNHKIKAERETGITIVRGIKRYAGSCSACIAEYAPDEPGEVMYEVGMGALHFRLCTHCMKVLSDSIKDSIKDSLKSKD